MKIPRLTTWQRNVLTRGMQLLLAAMGVAGLVTGNQRFIFGGLMALLVTFLPAVVERNYRVPLDPGLTAWITFFTMLHVFGSIGLYKQYWWWDDLMHTSVSALVTGIGYTVIRVIDRYEERVHIPSRFMFVFLLLFVMAAGVAWEVVEFFAGAPPAWTGIEAPVTQISLHDTMTDLLYDTLGGFLVAGGGHAYFNTSIAAIVDFREEHSTA